ncbi:MAG: MBOAT family protein [Magnetococcales bacterium]|nr:MBOAT family protein [Magnetococcales bacterium]
MSFADPIFIFLFLPITLIGYRLFVPESSPDATQGIVGLTLASVFFYIYWDIRFAPILLISICINFVMAAIIRQSNHAWKKFILITAIGFNIFTLIYFKSWSLSEIYLHTVQPFMPDMLQKDYHTVMPLGVSFFTFTQIAYLVDISRGQLHEKSPLSYFLFVTWFPHLMAGPIIHHHEMMPQFRDMLKSPLRSEYIGIGITWIAIGLAKKVLLADSLATHAAPLFQDAEKGALPTFFPAWTGALAYTLQLYFDFSGYSDMAIGLSYLFGVKMPLNFNSPYQATSIIDFWHRWHMTLSSFLRNYLYIPLGGNQKGNINKYINIMIVMLLGGLWHGVGATFLVWGGLHGSLLVLNHLWRAWHGTASGWLAHATGRSVTFICVTVGWVIFYAKDLPSAWRVLNGMAGMHGIDLPVNPGALASIALLLMVVWWLPNSQQILSDSNAFLPPRFRSGATSEHASTNRAFWRWQPTAPFALFVGVILLLSLSKIIFSPGKLFLYYQF